MVDAAEIRARLETAASSLSGRLTDDLIQKVMSAPPTYRDHPLALARLPSIESHASLVRWPHDSADDLRSRIDAQERELHGLRERLKG